MDILKLSQQYFVRLLNDKDLNNIYEIEINNPLYYQYCPPVPSIDNIKRDMKAFPPNKTLDDKYYVGYFHQNELICILDLIDHYPNNHAVFIGFFMVKKEYQKKNVGSSIIFELISYFKKEDYEEIRLGYVKGNPQSKAFWEKNKFQPTGVIAHEEFYDIIVLKKVLNSY